MMSPTLLCVWPEVVAAFSHKHGVILILAYFSIILLFNIYKICNIYDDVLTGFDTLSLLEKNNIGFHLLVGFN